MTSSHLMVNDDEAEDVLIFYYRLFSVLVTPTRATYVYVVCNLSEHASMVIDLGQIVLSMDTARIVECGTIG